MFCFFCFYMFLLSMFVWTDLSNVLFRYFWIFGILEIQVCDRLSVDVQRRNRSLFDANPLEMLNTIESIHPRVSWLCSCLMSSWIRHVFGLDGSLKGMILNGISHAMSLHRTSLIRPGLLPGTMRFPRTNIVPMTYDLCFHTLMIWEYQCLSNSCSAGSLYLFHFFGWTSPCPRRLQFHCGDLFDFDLDGAHKNKRQHIFSFGSSLDD